MTEPTTTQPPTTSNSALDGGLDGRKSGRRAGVALAATTVATIAVVWIFGSAAYLWIKSIHVVAVMSWMAGLLYLPRLFIYHCDARPGSEQSETFKTMEQRLLNIIMTPAMVVSWALGLWLGWQAGFMTSGWFHAKLLAVAALTGAHGYLSISVREFGNDRNTKPARHWRIINEVPTVLMILIVVLVIVKPF
jgi:protoporphyrinogen IX oxidase